MRILHLLNHTRTGNGHVHVAVDLACAQAKRNHQVMLVSIGGDFDALLVHYGVPHHRAGIRREPWSWWSGVRDLRRELRGFRPDVIHAHMAASTVLARIAIATSPVGLVATAHNDFAWTSALQSVADRVVAVSAAGRDRMRRRGVPAAKLRVVINGTVGSALRPRAFDMPGERVAGRITFCGGMHPRKGVDVLLEAFAILAARSSEAELLLVGNGPRRAEYEETARRLGITSRVSFLGYRADPRSVMQSADIFVLPSLEEPGGLVLCEAMDAGCAVVATRVGGNPEYLGSAGLLVEPGSPAALADALMRLLADRALLARHQALAADRAGQFTIDRVSDDYLRIYEEVATPPETRTLRTNPTFRAGTSERSIL